jgi:hypothetical protein
MKRYIILAISTSVSAVFAARILAPTASPAQESAALDYTKCLVTAALQRDDGVSDIASIAQTIELLCADKFQTANRTLGSKLNREAQETQQVKSATEAVLGVRRIRRDFPN